MPQRKSKPANLTDALLATIADPNGTTQRLLGGAERPRYALTSVVIFVAVCIAPPLLQGGYRGGSTFDAEYVGSIAMTTALTAICTSFLVAFSIHAIGSKRTLLRSAAALAYSTTPISVVVTLLYILSRISMGSCTLLTFLSSGVSLPDDLVVRLYPHAFRASLALAFLTLSQGLRTVSRASLVIGGMMAAVAVLLLLGSFVLSLAATDLVYPSTSSRTIEFFGRYFSYPR